MKILIVLLLAAVAHSARLAPLLTNNERIPGRYIVKLKPGRDVDTTITSLGGGAKVFQKYRKLFPGFAAQLTGRMVDFLRSSDAVEYIEEDGIVRASSVASWGLDRIDQVNLPLDDVYEPIGDGAGVTVYVIDTGINFNHTDFVGRVELGYDLYGRQGNDCNGHGTHCAGIAAGTQYGVAKAAHIVVVRIVDCMGSTTTSGFLAGCDWTVYHSNSMGNPPSVVSLSVGAPSSRSLDDAVKAVIDAGITVAVAAGNSDKNACFVSPARLPEAITIGATDSADTCTIFSNYGSCIDLFAPGYDIVSSGIGSTDASKVMTGTSMAAPHVAGAVAILLGNNFNLSPAAVSSMLLQKAISGAVSDPGPESTSDLLLYIGEGNGDGYIPYRNISGCGGFFNESSGSFATPNHPNNYLVDLSCSYLISGVMGDLVTINFTAFDLEPSSGCFFDYVSIYDGTTTSAPLIGTWCGSGITAPDFVTSRGSDVLVVFTSDDAHNYRGFSATYVIGDVPDLPETGECGHVFSSEIGKLTSPNHPDKYPSNEDCTFTIHGSIGKTITLTFDFFEVEKLFSNCRYDYLKVFDGVDESGTLLEKMCGYTLPRPITTSGNSMYVHFVTDGDGVYRGFSASYVIQ